MKFDMKKPILMAFMGLLTVTFAYGQKVSEVSAQSLIGKLSDVKDQYGKAFSTKKLGDELTLIFVEGYREAFVEVYSKFKGKKLPDNVRVVGGMAGMGGNMKGPAKYSHLASGFSSEAALGKEGYSVFFDMDDESLKMLELGRYAVATLSVKENKVTIKDFGKDRAGFIKAIRGFFD